MRNIWFLALTSLFADVAGEMIVPVLPLFFTKGLGLPVVLLGVIEGVSEAVGTMLRMVFGYASDRTRKRKIFVVSGYFVAAAGKFFLIFARSWPMVFVARFFDRAGKGVRTAPRDAMIASSVEKIQRPGMYGFHRMMDTAGAIIGNILATIFLLFSFSFDSIFLLSLIPAIIAVFLLIPVKETDHFREEKFVSFREIFRTRQFFGTPFWKFTFASGLFQLGNVGYSFLLLRATSFDVAVFLIPILYLVFNIFQAVFSWPVGRMANRYGKEFFMLIGFIFYAIMAWGFAFSGGNLPFLFVLFAVYGIFFAFYEVLSRACVADLLPDDKRASGLGAYSTLMGLMLIPASIIGGLLWKFGNGFGTFLYSASITSLAAFIFFLFFSYLWFGKTDKTG